MPVADRPALIIHAGFHKTGTTSVQRALDLNRDALQPWRILLKHDIPALCAAAQAYARAPQPEALDQFRAATRKTIAQRTPCPTVISAEDLTGLIPGRQSRRGYPAAPALLAALVQSLPDYEVQIYLSTRSAASWMKSCHAHHLRHTRCQNDLATYVAAQAGDADLAGIARDIGAALAPTPVIHAALDQSAALPQGPLTPLLDLMAVPENIRRRLAPIPAANVSLPDPILDALLELNQSELDRTTLVARKRALVADHRRTRP